MTLTELHKSVIEAWDMAASLGWDADDVTVTVRVSTGGDNEMVLIRKAPGGYRRLEIALI